MIPKDPDYIAIALEIMERIEKGGLQPWENRWKKDWVDDYRYGGRPLRPDGTAFGGDNLTRLRAVAKKAGLRSPYWFTAGEARRLRAKVKSWDRGVTVRWATADDGTVIHAGEHHPLAAMLPMDEHVVWNARRIDELPAKYRRRTWEMRPLNRDEPLPHVKAFIEKLGLKVVHRIDVANPTPGMDENTGFIGMPQWELFPDGASYYRAIAHEAVHWARRERHNVFEGPGAELRRSWEEVVADIGAAFLVADLTGSRAQFDDQVLFVNDRWAELGEDVPAVMAAAAAAEASMAWLHQLAPGYRAVPVGTRRSVGAQEDRDPGGQLGEVQQVLDAMKEAREFVGGVAVLPGQRYESHTAWFRDRFRLLDTAGRIDLGIEEVRNAVRAEAMLATGDVTLVSAEAYIDSVRKALQADMEQAVAEIHLRWNTAPSPTPSPSSGIRL